MGINPLDFILRVIQDYKNAHPKIIDIFDEVFKVAQEEYKDTKGELIEFYSQPEQLEILREGGFRKLNIHYAGRVSVECSKEFIDYYKYIAKELLKEKGCETKENLSFVDDCCRFMHNRFLNYKDLLKMTKGKSIDKKIKFNSKILDWISAKEKTLTQDYYRPKGITYDFYIKPLQKNILQNHLKRFKGSSGEYQMSKLQETVHGMHKKNLLYQIRQAS